MIFTSVVIPTLGRYNLLQENLVSISLQSYLPDEVIIVDGCMDKSRHDEITGRFAKSLKIKFLPQTKKSIPCARNQGAEAGNSDIIIFTDDDCIFDKEWIGNLIRPFIDNPKIGIVGGEILTEAYSNSLLDNYFVDMKMSRVAVTSDTKWFRGYVPGEIAVKTGFAIQPFFTGANMAVRREAFNAIGRFDTDFKTNEDLEFCIRAAKNGWKLYFEPNAIAKHKPPRSLKHVLRSWYDYGLYHGPLFRKYNNKITEVYIYKSWVKRKGVYPNFFSFIFKTPLNAVIFINSFHFMNTALILAIISRILSYNELYILFVFLFFLALLRYLWPRAGSLFKLKTFIYLGINYLLNFSYSLGAFIGGLKNGVFYLEATVDEVR